METLSAARWECFILNAARGHLGEVLSAEPAGGSESCCLAKFVLILQIAQRLKTSKLAIGTATLIKGAKFGAAKKKQDLKTGYAT